MLTAIVLNLLVGCAVVAAQTATVNVTITTTVTTGTSTPCGVYGFYPVRPPLCPSTDGPAHRHQFGIAEHIGFNVRLL